jgi:hypothetical protein
LSSWWRRTADSGDTDAMVSLGQLLADHDPPGISFLDEPE